MHTLDNGLNAYDPKDLGRKFMAIIYPDARNYDCERVLQCVDYWSKTAGFSALWILHDKDDVKPHYHVTLKLTNKHSCASVRKHLSLPEEVELCEYDDFERQVLYMLHWENQKE